ncbi:fk506-binding protein 2 precursor [Stemphylium lycopersici]|uniref:peptidylprolyl isomerase n=1 Tax=Stemphylium lycopersici TaxID=183478 RepID=A0A364MXX0_STELY|nr:fk506-binding protein 2 precursor [Stemphylium lycopersici]
MGHRHPSRSHCNVALLSRLVQTPNSTSTHFEARNMKHLATEVITPAECVRKTQAGDKVNVHYRGTLQDGTEFDASYNRGQPLSFSVGQGQVIKGWDQGLLDMCPGEKRKLTIQPEWAYGSRGAGPIPANSVLIFESELVSIDGVDKEEL